MLAPAAVLLLKASVVLIAALFLARALRGASAAARHQMWSAVFVALLAVPVVGLMVPGFGIPVPVMRPAAAPADSVRVTPVIPPLPIADIDTSLLSNSGRLFVQQAQSAPPMSGSPAKRLAGLANTLKARMEGWTANDIFRALFILWLGGVGVSLLRLGTSLVRVRRMQARAAELNDAQWRAAADRIAARFGITQPVRVLASNCITTPMAGGILHPVIFVPANAHQWSAEVRDIVLTHEMAHLASRDPLRLMVSRFALAVYWMHPLAWVAARRATAACEQACDEAVLDAGVRPSNYASVLLDFAAAPEPRFSAALPIVRRTLLENRLVAILNQSSSRARRSRPVVVVAGTFLLMLTVAAAKPAAVPETLTTRLASLRASATRAVASRGIRLPRAVSPRVAEACALGDRGSFSGSISMSDHSGSTVIHEQVGRSGSDYIIEKSFDGMRVCALGRDMDGDSDVVPSAWSRRARLVVLETRTPREVRHMEIADGRVTYTVNGASKPVDEEATAWRTSLFGVLDDSWRLTNLRGRASTLRGEISSVHGSRSSLHGEISSLQGEVSAMRGEISSWRGHESSLRGEISSIRGHVSSLQGAISSERGAISSLEASRWDANSSARERIDERIRRHEERIREIEREIRRYDADARVRAVEHRIASLDVDGEIARIERRIRDFDLDAQVAAIQRRIAQLDVDDQVRAIERQIDGLDLDDSVRQLESRISASLRRLRSAMQ